MARNKKLRIVAIRFDGEKWDEFKAYNRERGITVSAALREHIDETLSNRENRKAEVAIAEELESFITAGGSDSE